MRTNVEKGMEYTWGAIISFGKLALIVAVVVIFGWILGYNVNDTDKSTIIRSGMRLHTDAETGLQYLSVEGALIPRLDQQGRHMKIEFKK